MLRRVLILAVGLGLVAWSVVWWVSNREFRTELQTAKRELVPSVSVGPEHGWSDWPSAGPGAVTCNTGSVTARWRRGTAMAPSWHGPAFLADSPEGRLAALASGGSHWRKGTFPCRNRSRPRDTGRRRDCRRARFLRGRLHWLTGRHDEYRRYLRREVENGHDAAQTLRLLWSIDHDGYPVDEIRRELDQARTAAPDDDRVWLALADLATRTGRFDEASELLARCEQSRPDDPAVWRTRLRGPWPPIGPMR